jgi:hypothetical protein
MTAKSPILEKLEFLWENRRPVRWISLGIFAFFVVVILLLPPVYVANTTVFPKEGPKFGGGGGSSLLLGAVGLSPLQNAMMSRIEILLTSDELSERAVARDSLLPELFPAEWDAASGTWESGKAPSLRVAGKVVSQMILLESNPKGYIKMSVEAHSPALAARVLKAQLNALDERLRLDAELDLKSNLDFLNSQLAQTADPLLRDKILGLMASYIEGAVYANAKAFDLSENPRAPLRPDRPRKGLLLLLAALGAVSGACVAMLGLRTFGEIRRSFGAS